MPYIYLLQHRAAINANENIYKIGRTQDFAKRLQGYEKGYKILLLLFVENHEELETCIIDDFKQYFVQCNGVGQYGNEYFQGDCNEMVSRIMTLFKVHAKTTIPINVMITALESVKAPSAPVAVAPQQQQQPFNQEMMRNMRLPTDKEKIDSAKIFKRFQTVMKKYTFKNQISHSSLTRNSNHFFYSSPSSSPSPYLSEISNVLTTSVNDYVQQIQRGYQQYQQQQNQMNQGKSNAKKTNSKTWVLPQRDYYLVNFFEYLMCIQSRHFSSRFFDLYAMRLDPTLNSYLDHFLACL